jgi:hypothetical protein
MTSLPQSRSGFFIYSILSPRRNAWAEILNGLIILLDVERSMLDVQRSFIFYLSLH